MRKALFYMLAAAGAGYVAVIYNSRGFLALFGAAVLLPPFLLSMLWYSRRRLECVLLFSPCQERDGRYQVSLLVTNHSPFYLAKIRARIVLNYLDPEEKYVPERKGMSAFFRPKRQTSERQDIVGKTEYSGQRSRRRRKRTLSFKAAGKAGAGETVRLTGTAECLEFGPWQAECPALFCYDCLGLFSWKKKVRQKKKVMVFPACYETNIKAGIRTRLFLADGEVYHPQTKGDDPSEVLNLRDYQKGDRLNRIHWKLSARNDTLIVSEMSLPIGCNVVLFLDACTDVMDKERRRVYWEIVNTISQGLLQQECFHYLAWYDAAEQRLKRKAVREFEDLTDFWGEIIKYRMGRQDFSKEYGQEFRGESYVTGIVWNQELELYCNGKFLMKAEPAGVKEQMLELELIV